MSHNPFAINRSLAGAGREAMATTQKTDSDARFPVWNMDQGSYQLQFLTDPWDDAPDWVFYREVAAWDGVIGGGKLPAQLLRFPVSDRKEVVIDGEPKLQYHDRPESEPAEGAHPLSLYPCGYDPLLPLIAPNTKYGNDRPSVSDRWAVNVVVHDWPKPKKPERKVPAEGSHLVLRIPAWQFRTLMETFEMQHDMDADFTITDKVWAVTFAGQGLEGVIKAKLTAETPLDVTQTELIDVNEMLLSIRQAVESFVGGLVGVADTDEFAADSSETDLSGLDEFLPQAEEAEPVSADSGWAAIRPNRIRQMLRAEGIKVPAKATKADLIEMAQEHLDANAAS